MDDNQDAIELKRRARRRLVGAIALVVFVVIVLPIIFDHEPKSLTQYLSIQIPSQDSVKGAIKAASTPVLEQVVAAADPATPSAPVSQSVPAINAALPAPSSAAVSAPKELAKPAGMTESPEAEKADVARADPPKSEKKVSEPKPASKPGKDPTKVASSSAVKDDPPSTPAAQAGFYVPLGVFSKSENVRQAQSRVSAAGFKSYAEKSSGTAQTKVRAGPFATREAAENARDKLKSAGMDVGAVGSR